jgi:hypothetical protein
LEIIYKQTDFDNLEHIFSETFKTFTYCNNNTYDIDRRSTIFFDIEEDKTFILNTMAEERLNSLAILSIEKKWEIE